MEVRARHHLPAGAGCGPQRGIRSVHGSFRAVRHPQADHRCEARPFGAGDIIPLPCNPESIAIGYALRNGDKIAPITSYFPKDMLVEALPNAITFEKYPDLHKQILNFFSLSTVECNNPEQLDALLCCLPQIPVPEGMGYENIFRIAIVEFLDPHNFCIGRVKRSCVHFVTPAGQIIPFDTYNLFYRDVRRGSGWR